MPPEAGPLLAFLDELMRFDGSSREVITLMLGAYMFDWFNYK